MCTALTQISRFSGISEASVSSKAFSNWLTYVAKLIEIVQLSDNEQFQANNVLGPR